MGRAYKGEEIIFAVKIIANEDTLVRPFNQTDGSRNISADEIELDTKDGAGADYGKVTEEVSLDGIVTEGDPFVDFAKEAIRGKKFIEIYEINKRTLEAEKGEYMIQSFEKTYSNGEFANYNLSAKLNGVVTKETITEIPEGAQDVNP
ncbi:phage major tail protein, TP901-1 family [Alkalihalobacillus pseudalcaliphilus]|uniref:phage major tail protein, TP901-1 family n=1 Tax=Alkalihalobacillus pseudalcaliphilus TaxID=79884 RepID=UPI0009FD1328|nr:phage major tail protein, TP901-1 family [Alkalihalobacillus pseudalcaliphilus]